MRFLFPAGEAAAFAAAGLLQEVVVFEGEVWYSEHTLSG